MMLGLLQVFAVLALVFAIGMGLLWFIDERFIAPWARKRKRCYGCGERGGTGGRLYCPRCIAKGPPRG